PRLSPRLPLRALLRGKVAGLCFGAFLALAAAPAAPGRIGIAVALGLPAAGFFVPDALLDREARRRRRRLVAALPDALDLLAVSVASGRGPADGLAQLARAGEGPLAEQMRIAVPEPSCRRPLPAPLPPPRVPGSGAATPRPLSRRPPPLRLTARRAASPPGDQSPPRGPPRGRGARRPRRPEDPARRRPRPRPLGDADDRRRPDRQRRD